MPGVPSGRGCEECRRQKKKCDQLKPSCSRCHRLRIVCLGSGVQRYKFMRTQAALKTTSTKEQLQAACLSNSQLPRALDNSVSLLTRTFVEKTSMSDLRFSITFACGSFLTDIPRRLGTNKALDAAAEALTSNYMYRCNYQLAPKTYATYYQAIRALRESLTGSSTPFSPNTLCALYFVWVCQYWSGTGGGLKLCHGQALVYMLDNIDLREWEGVFEQQLLLTLCSSLVFESFANPAIQLKPWQKAVVLGPEPIQIDDAQNINEETDVFLGKLMLYSLIRTAELLRDNKRPDEPRALYEILRVAAEKLRARVSVAEINFHAAADAAAAAATADGPAKPLGAPPPLVELYLAAFQRAHGLALFLAIVVNRTARAYVPDQPHDDDDISDDDSVDDDDDDDNDDMNEEKDEDEEEDDDDEAQLLDDECARLVGDIVALARQAARFRPLGAGYMPVYLCGAWAAATGAAAELEVENALAAYEADPLMGRAMDEARRMRGVLEDFRGSVARSSKVGVEEEEEDAGVNV